MQEASPWNDILVLVLAGGTGSRLRGLTRTCAKPALPFGGQYRIIDFTLSNCFNSGLRRVALLTQYESDSLIAHVQPRWQAATRQAAPLSIEFWESQHRRQRYAGTADAVHQNRHLLEAIAPKHVLVTAGDHIYAMDYRPMLEAHTARGADLTVSCVAVPVDEAHAFGIVELDAQGGIDAFIEKPRRPRSASRDGQVLASMGIYLFETRFLLDCLEADAVDDQSSHDFGYSILPRVLKRANVHAHRFGEAGHARYWRDVGTVDSYWRAHMDLLAEEPKLDLTDPQWPLHPAGETSHPARIMPRAEIKGSLLSVGCLVGGYVHRSVLSSHSRVERGAFVQDSVLLPGARVGRNCVLDRVIVDSDTSVPDDTILDGGLLDAIGEYERSADGVALITAPPAQTAATTNRRPALRAVGRSGYARRT